MVFPTVMPSQLGEHLTLVPTAKGGHSPTVHMNCSPNAIASPYPLPIHSGTAAVYCPVLRHTKSVTPFNKYPSLHVKFNLPPSSAEQGLEEHLP